MPTIVLIDDETPILIAVRTGLRARGYTVITAQTGQDGLGVIANEQPDVVLLDLALPDLDGIEVCRRIREWSQVPILVLSADDSEARKVAALDEGADDYITKPFGMAELQARLRVALRHHGGSANDAVYSFGPLAVDVSRRQVQVHGQEIELTGREFDLLAYLCRHAGKVITHRMLLEELWGPGYTDQTNYLRVYANRLRRKLGDEAAGLIRTRPGVGYQLVDDEQAISKGARP